MNTVFTNNTVVLSFFNFLGTGSFFIDIDHYIRYVSVTRVFNFKKVWNALTNSGRKVIKDIRTSIHRLPGFIGFNVLLIILFFVTKTGFWVVFIAYYTHMILDYLSVRSWLKIRKRTKASLFGFNIEVPLYEIYFDVALIILFILLFFF